MEGRGGEGRGGEVLTHFTHELKNSRVLQFKQYFTRPEFKRINFKPYLTSPSVKFTLHA